MPARGSVVLLTSLAAWSRKCRPLGGCFLFPAPRRREEGRPRSSCSLAGRGAAARGLERPPGSALCSQRSEQQSRGAASCPVSAALLSIVGREQQSPRAGGVLRALLQDGCLERGESQLSKSDVGNTALWRKCLVSLEAMNPSCCL